MFLPQWLYQLAQRWSLPNGNRRRRAGRVRAAARRRVRPYLEVLEERLTPSSDVLVFTTPAVNLFFPGQVSPPISVQLQDGHGNAVNATSNETVQLSSSSSGGQFLDTFGQALANPSITIQQGTSSASFEYKDSQVGFPTLQANASALNAKASQQEDAGVSVTLAAPSQPLLTSQVSPPITLRLSNSSNGQPFTASSAMTFQLSSSSGTGQFLDTSGQALANSSITIPAGSSSAQFEYKDSTAGLPTLTAAITNGIKTSATVDVGTALVFTTAPQNLTANQPSGAITVQLQDSSAHPINVSSPTFFFLSSNSKTGKFLDTSGNPLFNLIIPAGSNSASFKYQDSIGGKPTLTATGSGINAAQQETVAGPFSAAFGTPPPAIAPNTASQPVTIQLQDSTGNGVNAVSALTIKLSSSSGTGQFLDTTGHALANSSITIPAGSSSVQFEYKDSTAGFPTLTLSENGLTNTTLVNVGVSLVFTTSAQSIAAGTPSSAITVQLQDSKGNAVNAPSFLGISFSSNSQTGKFLDSSGNPLPFPSVTIQQGSNSATFEYEDTIAGKPTLTASSALINGLTFTASQQETVTGPYNLAFVNPVQSIAQNTASQPILIQLMDSTNRPVAASSPVTIQLSSSSGTGQFLDTSGQALANSSITVPAGSSTAQFEYKDSTAGLPTLSLAQTGLTVQALVDVGVSLVFNTAAQTLTAGKRSSAITLQLQDSKGNAVTAPNDLNLTLSSNSKTGQFFNTSGAPLTTSTITLPAGSNSVSFQYEDSVEGKPTLTASWVTSGSLAITGTQLSASQQETVSGPDTLTLTNLPPIIAQNTASQPITIQLHDSLGNAVKARSPVTIKLSSSSSTGQFLDGSGKALTNSSITIPTGSSSVQFEYKDSTAGFASLTATENGLTNGILVNVGVSLVFTTSAQKLTAGQPSGNITVQLQDNKGHAVAAPSALTISGTSSSISGKFLANSLPATNFLSLTLAAGSSSASFQYEDTIAGAPTLTLTGSLLSTFQSISVPNAVSLSANQQETVTGPYNLLISSVSQALAPNQPSQLITVNLQDSSGNVVKAASAVTVKLSSSSGTGQFLDTSGKALANSSITIPAGSSTVQFEYKDSTTGLPTLTASENGFSSQQQVSVGVKLAFTTPPQTLAAGQTSQPVTVQLQDSNGHAFTTPTDLTVNLSSFIANGSNLFGSADTVQFITPSSSSSPFNALTIATGSNSASFQFVSPTGGTPTLSASLSSFSAVQATQKETITGVSALVFTSAVQTLTVGQMSQLVTLKLEDENGNAIAAPSGGIAIDLYGSGTSLASPVKFFDANGNPLSTSHTLTGVNAAILTIPAGSSTISFKFESTQAGPVSILASVPVSAFSNAFSATQLETLKAGPPTTLVFATPEQFLQTNEASGSISVQLTDQYGNLALAPSGGVTVNLSSSSSSGHFLSASGDALASAHITIPQGASSALFEYQDSQVGTPTLTASATGLSSATQQEAITPTSSVIHVSNTNDSGANSLRAAIVAANANPGSEIVFDAGAKGTINLLSALPTLTASTNIVGPGANVLTIARGSSAVGVFNGLVIATPVLSSSTFAVPTVAISGLTVANFNNAGISNYASLSLHQVDVSNNTASSSFSNLSGSSLLSNGAAGGIANSGTLTLLDSTVADNTVPAGVFAAAGGISSTSSFFNSFTGTSISAGLVTIVNSTVSGNKAASGGGAAGIDLQSGAAYIASSTISGNSIQAPPLGGSSGVGGIASDGLVTLYDTIVASNTGSTSTPTDVSGAFFSLGHNLIGAANNQSSGFVSSDKVGTTTSPINPKLGPLQNNGGPTPTMAPLTGSPALDAGSSVNAPSTDQRGDSRPRQGAIDIGAVEVTGATSLSAPVITLQPSSQSATTGRTVSFTATATSNPSPTVRWQISTNGGQSFGNLSDGPNTIGSGTNTLTLTNVQLSQSGHEYRAVFSNSVNSAPTHAATLTVKAPPPPAHHPSPSPSPAPSPSPSPSSSPSASPSPAPPPVSAPPVLALFNALLGGTETVNPDGSVTVTDSLFGLPLIVSHFSPTGQLDSVTLFGVDVTFVFELFQLFF